MNTKDYRGKTCKELGWKEGDTFKMSKDMDMNVYGISVGDVVTLFLDDGTDLPTYINSYGDEYFLYDYEVEKIENTTSEIKKLQDDQIAQTTLSGVANTISDLRNSNPTEFDAMTKQSDTCSLHSLLQDFHKGHDVAVVLTRDGYSLEFDNYTFTDLTLEKLTDKLELLKKLFLNEEV